METTKKSSRGKKAIESKKSLGRYQSMDELSAAKMESSKEFIANLDMALFKKNGHIE
ncbi:hypothetical protein GO755_07405 [Spirosoma sp. HMF4905]|uniref:Uncharacterized protein n=1 Tax=Spirosoma arboris TaxID=2682092 RepID=A0A7K1S7N7_9BACT|nr:hypothetical protein [Spirosoma arboris]MVM29853.1 hypothetical protein [Spirosoma arboris]